MSSANGKTGNNTLHLPCFHTKVGEFMKTKGLALLTVTGRALTWHLIFAVSSKQHVRPCLPFPSCHKTQDLLSRFERGHSSDKTCTYNTTWKDGEWAIASFNFSSSSYFCKYGHTGDIAFFQSWTWKITLGHGTSYRNLLYIVFQFYHLVQMWVVLFVWKKVNSFCTHTRIVDVKE